MGDRGTWQPKSNSMSSHEEKLAEYRETVLNNEALARIDRRKDPGIFWKPLPYDPRFPNINITGYCYSSYKDFHRCRELRGPNYEPCEYFKHVYTSVCPSAWYEAWDEQREGGHWFGDIKPDEKLYAKGPWLSRLGLRKRYDAVSNDIPK